MTTRLQTRVDPDGTAEVIDEIASHMADRLCHGFVAHDQREREAAVEAFAAVDRLQFAHVDESDAYRAATGYVDALWVKDEVEESCRVDGELDPGRLATADWSGVEAALDRRAAAAGIDSRYAELTTSAWLQHKTDGDYWTPMMHAQMLELRAALQNPTYPGKPRHGQGGFGPEPARYALGNELHDTRQWEQAREVMTPYFQRILDAHPDDVVADAIDAVDPVASD
ncbi:MAG: hypothetical protein ABEJ73_05375 [Haloplanus sp.]